MRSETTVWTSKPIPLINLRSLICGDKKVTQNVIDDLARRITHDRPLRVEYGHPDLSSLTASEASHRVLVIDERRVCGYLKDFSKESIDGEMWMTACFSLAGPYGNEPAIRDLIISALSSENARQHLKYRGITEPDGRTFFLFITWDFVLERQQ